MWRGGMGVSWGTLASRVTKGVPKKKKEKKRERKRKRKEKEGKKGKKKKINQHDE